MAPRQTQVKAGKEADALRLAAHALDTGPDNVLLTPAGDGLWSATLRNADADVEIHVSEDEMTAKVARYLPAVGQGAALGVERLAARLEQSGVRLPAAAKAVETLFARLRQGREIAGLVLVRGIEPVPGQPGTVKLHGDLRQPVFPGDVFATLIPPEDPQPGRTVTDREVLSAKAPGGAPFPPTLRRGCALTKDGAAICAEVYGLIQQKTNWIAVEPLCQVAADRMEVRGTIFPVAFGGRSVDVAMWSEALAAMAIRAPLEAVSLEAALGEARATGWPQENVLLGRGTPPVDGENGRFELLVETSQSVGTVREDGTMDFRERGTVHNVQAGAVLGRITPPGKGVPGTDVLGRALPARDGLPAVVAAGENVEMTADGKEFRSRIDGMVLFQNSVLAVTDIFEIRGDIDFATGNIHADKGSILIEGTVRSGFSVVAPGNVVVKEAIEGATVRAGGNVEVHRGLVMDGGGRIQAGGSVSAHFALQAQIQAGGEVIVDNDLTNCQVLARGRIVAVNGKGRIQGGTLRCGRGLEANEIGSELGVETVIVVGLEPEGHEELLAERAGLVIMVRKIDVALGAGDPRSILLRTAKAKRPAVAQLIKARIAARERIEVIDLDLEKQRQSLKQQAAARVVVRQVIHVGVTVTIAGSQLAVDHPLHACQLHYDPAADRIQIGPLA